MEDLATARISVAQIAQRVVHSSVGEDTERVHDLDLVKRIVADEGEDIIRLLGTDASHEQVPPVPGLGEDRGCGGSRTTRSSISGASDLIQGPS